MTRAQRAAMRRDYDAYVHAQYLQAEEATRGNMTCDPAFDPYRFFRSYGGTRPTVRCWGSDEMIEWWAGHYVLTLGEYIDQIREGEAEAKASYYRTLTAQRWAQVAA